MEKKFENGMVTALDQATLNEVQSKIESLTAQGYRVPNLPKVGPKTEGIVSGLFSGSAVKLPKDLSTNKEKRLKRLAARFLERPTWGNANIYLHFLYKKCIGQEKAPKVLLSEKEERIQQARKAWKKVQVEADRLRLAYKTEKGDFYKQKSAVLV